MPTIDARTHTSPNHSRRATAIACAVVHSCEGRPAGNEEQSSIPWLTNPASKVSSHYYITRAGTIYQLVPLDRAAWHAGVSALDGVESVDNSLNDASVGIELEHRAGGPSYPMAQLDALAWLLRYLMERYPAMTTERIVSHRAVALPRGRKNDPSDWSEDAFRAWVNALPPYTADSPILASPGAPIPTVILRFPTPAAGYTRTDVRVIVNAYWKTCLGVGVDPVLAIAQMAHETGSLSSWWSQRPRRNPAGIGVTGETRPGTDPQPQPAEVWHRDAAIWRRGNVFGSWERGSVPAHVGRLLAYALPEGVSTPAQQALIDYALAVRPLPEAYRGSAPTLRGLNGRWAVGAGYADAIAARANRLSG
jgi:hypothetical protein